MNKIQTKSDIVSTISDRLEINYSNAKKVYEIIVDILIDSVKTKGGFRLTGLGQINTVTKPPRLARNPSNGKTIQVPERRGLRWSTSSSIRRKLNG